MNRLQEFFMWAVLIALVYYAGRTQGRAYELEYSQYGYKRADERRDRSDKRKAQKRQTKTEEDAKVRAKYFKDRFANKKPTRKRIEAPK